MGGASIQLLCGLRIFAGKYLGFQIESAIGSPYCLEGGLTFRIPTRKKQ